MFLTLRAVMMKQEADSGRPLHTKAKWASALPKGEFPQIVPVAKMLCYLQINTTSALTAGIETRI